jgi:multiple sugar transport system substrate-binding protein
MAMPRSTTGAGQFSRRNFLRATGGLAVAGAFTAACGSNSGRSSSSSSTTLSQWYHQYGEAGTQQAAQRYAAAYKDAKVGIQWIPGDYPSKISSGLLASNGPDVFEYHFNMQLAKSGQVVPLDDIIADVKSDFNDFDLASNSLDGKTYGIRMIDDPQLLYYRKSFLTKAGIQPPTTLDELITATKALTTKSVKGLFVGNDNGVGWARDHLLATTGQSFLTADNKVGFASDTTAALLTKVRELVNTKGLLVGAPTDWWDPSAFNQGLAAIAWNGLWAMPAIQKALGDDFGVLPMPKFGDTGKPAIYLGGWSTFVNAKSKNVDAAKKFVKSLWIDNTADQEDWSLSYGFHIPPRKSLAAKATKLQTGPAAEVLKLVQQYAWVDNPAWTEAMRTAYTDATTNVILKGKNAKSEVATAASTVTAELTKVFG